MFGAYLAGLGLLGPLPVFCWTAAGNLASNVFIYFLGRRSGRSFIRNHPRLFHQDLLPRAALFFRKWGIWALFFSRFLVGFRSVAPLFAGISRFSLRKFLPPIICSIAIQHALMVYLGYTVGRKWEYIKSVLTHVNRSLAVVALILVVLIFLWFRRVKKSRTKRAERRRSRSD